MTNHQRSTESRALRALFALALVLAGCGDDVVPGDAGTDAGHADAAIAPIAPRVVATMPTDGEADVPPDATIRVLFSRSMRPEASALRIAGGSGPIAIGAMAWAEDGELLEVTPASPLEPGATITVEIGSAFESEEGAPLAEPASVSFTVADVVAPRVVSTTPAEGATVVPELDAIVVTLSEPIDARAATARLEGPGAATLGALRADGLDVTLPIAGALETGATYRLVLEGWRDAAGNALDASVLGAEGALDFTTGPDERAPVVLDASPSEGQLDVSATTTTRVALAFSEPMDEALGTATLVIGETRTELEPRWEAGGTRLVLSVAGLLALEAAHRVELAGYADLSGNALDGTPRLGDGALDFTTGSSTPPHVAYATPEDGRTDVLPGEAREIVVVFSEAMDTSRTTATLVGDGRSVELSGTWSMAGTTLRLDAAVINAGASYTLDLRAFEDATGVPLDAAHPYLGDGTLAFSLVAPSGERCGDALTQAQGEVLPNGHQWTIPALAVVADDGSASCDADGHGADMVVRYRKTTPAAGAPGGTVLHVRANIGGADLDLEVRQGSCDPRAEGAAATMRSCLWRGVFDGTSTRRSDVWIDGGEGDYFVWLAQEAREAFRGAAITIEEVPLPPEGESCLAPLTTSSASHSLGASGEHRWVLDQGALVGLDRAVTHTGEGALACDASGEMSLDGVVHYRKSSSTSLVTVEVDAATGSLTASGVSLEVGDACAPSAAGRSVLACERDADAHRSATITLDGPSRDLYAWLVANRSSSARRPMPAATLRIDEFEPGAGDTCATAIPIDPATTSSITPAGAHRAYAPACLAGETGVTWYRYTASERLGIVRTGARHTAAIVERATGRTLRCGDDSASGAAVIVPPGTEVCIALTSTGAPTSLSIDEVGEAEFDGVLGAATELGVTGSTSLSPRWIAATDADLWVRNSTSGLLRAPLAGGVPHTSSTVALTTGNAGVALPDGSVVTTTTAATSSGARLVRIVSAAGAVLATPAAIDTAPAGGYPSRRVDALTVDGADFLVATVGDPTVFYRVPLAGGQAVEIGRNDALTDVAGMAADATYLYVAGTVAGVEGVHRLVRADLATASQVPVTIASGMGLANDRVAIVVDDPSDAGAIYFRAESPADVWMVLEPGAPTPRWVGRIWQASASRADTGLAFDPARTALFVVDTSDTSGRWLRLE